MFEIPAALVLGWLTDRAAGDPARCHPVAGFGRLAEGLEARLWRPCRLTGTLFAGALVGAAGVAAALAWRLTGGRPLGRLALGSAVVWTALGGRSLERAALELAAAVERGDLPAARALLPTLAGRDPTALGAAELCRAGIESVAENTADAVTGPLLWGALAGPAGVAAYRAANTLDAMVGHRNERYERFGWAAARLDDLLTWPAARLAAGLAVVLAPVADGDPVRAWTVLRRDGSLHPSPNAGRLEAAFAGALGVGLGGVNSYGGRIEARPRMGADAGREPGPEDLRRAVRLSRATGWASTVMCAALALAGAGAEVRRKSVAIRLSRNCPEGGYEAVCGFFGALAPSWADKSGPWPKFGAGRAQARAGLLHSPPAPGIRLAFLRQPAIGTKSYSPRRPVRR